MFVIKSLMKHQLKKRKKHIVTALCCITLIYAAVQFKIINFSDDYSPLQLLSGVENEATRLLRFMNQVQVNCNTSVATNNASTWMICLDNDIGLASWSTNGNPSGIVYSVGPRPDFSFEWEVGHNLSQHLHLFSVLPLHRQTLLRISNSTNVYLLSVVPNDPADFGRNSYDTQTLNSISITLKHKHIDILKLDTMLDGVQTDDVLRFLIKDSFLQKVSELHVVIKLDKVDEDYIYSWYCTLYGLFHTAGYRLYHTASSDPLCLQDTIMESCVYYLSFIHKPPPNVFVMYPPAIDGSIEYEIERMEDFFQQANSKTIKFVPIMLKLTSHSPQPYSHLIVSAISRKTAIKNTQHSSSCTVVYILREKTQHLVQKNSNRKSTNCQTLVFAAKTSRSKGQITTSFAKLRTGSSHIKVPVKKQEMLTLSDIMQVLKTSSSKILYLESEDIWAMLLVLLENDIPKNLDELRVKAPIYGINGQSGATSGVIRKKYSILKQIEEFGLDLVFSQKFQGTSLKYGQNLDLHILHFVRKSLV